MLFKYLLIYIAVYFGLLTSFFFVFVLFENRKKIKNVAPPKKLPFVSVIIPAYNEGMHIAKTITSVANLNYPKNKLEIIVVDDGSIDDTYNVAKKIAKRFGNLKIKIFRKKNGGKASAMNLGIVRAKGEFVAGLDADSFVTPDALMKMIGYFSDSTVMSVTPSLKVYKPRGILRRIQALEYLWGVFLRKTFSFINTIHVAPGPFSIFRKSFFEKHGYFDENNLTEDTEIALRIQKNNYRIENSMDANVYTVAPSSFSALLKQRLRWYYGYTKNVQQYSELFSPKYGYLAMFALPTAFISVFILIALMGYLAWEMIDQWIRTISNLNAINFDLSVLFSFKNFEWGHLPYIFTSPVTVFIVITFALGLMLTLVAKYKSNEKESIKLNYLYFLLFYSIFYVFWWLVALGFRLFGGKVEWGSKIKIADKSKESNG